MDGTCNMYGGMRTARRSLLGKLHRKRPFGRPRHRWDGNIKM
jgi:hypothetical protein